MTSAGRVQLGVAIGLVLLSLALVVAAVFAVVTPTSGRVYLRTEEASADDHERAYQPITAVALELRCDQVTCLSWLGDRGWMDPSCGCWRPQPDGTYLWSPGGRP